MANQQTTQEKLAALSPEQVAMMRILIEEMKKPYVDQEVEARKLRARERLKQERDAAAESIERMQDGCNHLRGDGTSRVAWAQNYHVAKNVYITEGPCMACQKFFKPGVKGYESMLQVPIGMSGLIR